MNDLQRSTVSCATDACLRRWLTIGVSAASLMMGGGSALAATTTTPTQADPTEHANVTGLSEVVVTARKRAENLQNVPLAITALTSADLRAAGVQDLRDITFQTPGLTFNDSGANTFEKPIIRGQVDIGGGENNVPVFFDGIYISNSSAIDLGLVDLARVEVIKGPVSALYGRSAYAGAINYVSAKPGDTARGFLDVTAGQYGRFNARGSIDGPILGDTLKGGVSASYDRFDGTYQDNVTGGHLGGYDKKDILGNLDYTPNSHIEIRPVVYYGHDSFDDSPVIFAPANCSVGAGYGYSQSFCGHVPDGTFQGPYASSNSAGYHQTGNTRDVLLANLQIAVTYDWGTITSLTGANSITTKSYTEFDDQRFGTATATYYLPPGATVGGFPTGEEGLGGLPTGQTVLTPLHFGYTDKNRDFSQELRYRSPQLGAFSFSAGAYYAYTRHYEDLTLGRGTLSVPAGQYIIDPFAVPPGQSASGQHSQYIQKTNVYAGFLSAEYKITSQLTAETELRYTATDQSYRDLYAIFTPNPYGCLGYSTSCASTPNPIGPGTLSKTFYTPTSRTTLNFKPTRETLLYLSVANGDKTGGFNNNTTYPTFSPEHNWTYEAGFKSQFLDNRLQFDADVFYIDASHYQIYGPPPGASLPGGFITTNYGGLSTKGFEISAIAELAPGVKLSGGIGYADPKFKHDAYDFGDVTLCAGIPGCAGRIVSVGPNQAVSLQGLRPPYESNTTFNVALDLRHEIANGVIGVARVDYRYESSQYYQYPIDTGSFGPKNVVNLRAGLEKGPISFTVFVRNLTNDHTPVTVQDAAVTGASNFQAGYFPIALLPDQRTIGGTLRFSFGG